MRSCHRNGFPDFQLFSMIMRICTGPGSQSTDQTIQFCCCFRKVQFSHLFGDQGRVAGLGIILLFRYQFACLQQRQCLGDRFPAQHHQLVMQSFEGVLRSNGDFLPVQHIAGVQSRIHLHDGHTSLGLSVDDHSLDRRCPAVFRKEGCMDVQTSVFRQIQNLLRQDLSERRHDINICGIFFQFLNGFRCLDPTGLEYRNAMFYRTFLHGRKL